MVELKLYVSEVDFEAAIELFGGAVGGVAAMAAKALPDSAKEELAVRYLNASAQRLEEMLEQAAARKGVHVKISGAEAVVVKDQP